MAKNVFVSYDHDDQHQVSGFKLLNNSPRHPLDFHDHSLKDAVTDRSGRPIRYSPSDPKSQPVRKEIIAKFKNSSKLVVLIGKETHLSEWVEWEVNTFYEMKRSLSQENTWKRIRGMYLKGCETSKMPRALLNGKSTKQLPWNPTGLDSWLDQDPDV